MTYLILLIPFLNALFGWWILDSLFLFIFRPYDPVKFFGRTVHGLLPSMQEEISLKAGEWAEQMLSSEKIERFLLSEENKTELHIYLDEKADDFIRNKLTERISLLKMFITEGIIVQAKEVLVEQLDKMIPEIIKGFAPKISAKINIKEEVQIRIMNFPLQHIENQIFKIAKNRINRFKFFIAALGFILGLLEISLFYIS